MSVHKATPASVETPGGERCIFCGEPIKLVPGGWGPVWVHEDGYVTARDDEVGP